MPPSPPKAPLGRTPDLLERELTLLVARLRDFSPTRYAAPAPPFASRAATLWHLAGYLVTAAGIEAPLPALPDMALADVIAVTGHDLCAARPPEIAAAAALAEVLLHRSEIDASLPGRRAAGAALRVLDPAEQPTPAALLRVARARCPAYRAD